MTTLSYFILIITLVMASLAVFQMNRLRLNHPELPLASYYRAIWGLGIITLIHVGETVVYVIYGYTDTPVLFGYTMRGINLLVGLLRLGIPFDFGRFLWALVRRKWHRGLTLVQIGLMILLLSGHAWVLLAIDERGKYYRNLLHFPRFIFSLVIFMFALSAWRTIKASAFRSERRTIRLVSVFLGILAFLLLFFRFMNEVTSFFYITGSTLRILTILLFYLFNFLYSRRLAKTLSLYRKLDDPKELEKMMTVLSLSHREAQIVTMIEEGKTNKEIADEFDLSPYTIRDHCSRIMQKTGVHNRTQLAGLMKEP